MGWIEEIMNLCISESDVREYSMITALLKTVDRAVLKLRCYAGKFGALNRNGLGQV